MRYSGRGPPGTVTKHVGAGSVAFKHRTGFCLRLFIDYQRLGPHMAGSDAIRQRE